MDGIEIWNSRKLLPFRMKVPTNHIYVKAIYLNCFEMSVKVDSSLFGLVTFLMLFVKINPLRAHPAEETTDPNWIQAMSFFLVVC